MHCQHKFDKKVPARDHYERSGTDKYNVSRTRTHILAISINANNSNLHKMHFLSPSFQYSVDKMQTEPRGQEIVKIHEINNWPSDCGGKYNPRQCRGTQNCRGGLCQFRERIQHNLLYRGVVWKAKERGAKPTWNLVIEKKQYAQMFWMIIPALPPLANVEIDSTTNCPRYRTTR